MRQIRRKEIQIPLAGMEPPVLGGRGGERESEANILQVVIWDGLRWPNLGPDEPDTFWGYWLHHGDEHGEDERIPDPD